MSRLQFSHWALSVCALAGCCLGPAGPAAAELVPVNLALDPPTPSVNTLEVGLTLDTPLGQQADTDVTTVSGNVLATLEVDLDPETYAAAVTGLEFAGGTVALTRISYSFDFGLLGTAGTVGENIVATTDTPVPPGSVSGTAFPTIEHEVIFNGGTITSSGTGLVGAYIDGLGYDLSADPVATATDETGTLTVSTPHIVDLEATYDVAVTMPVDFFELVVEAEGISAYLGVVGTVQASGQFTRVIPQPATWGDINGDGIVDGLDIQPFVDLLTGGGYQAEADINADSVVDGLDIQPFVDIITGLTPGDVNGDGVVDGLDIQPFVDLLTGGGYQAEADINGDSVVDGLDIQPFVDIITGAGGESVPEPATLSLLAFGGLAAFRRRRR